LEEDQFKSKLLLAIEKLNETQRVAFLMHRIDGKKYAQIAEELAISVKAVEKRIHLALVELRKEFDYFK
jgi:RNA polymerase sigma-70 factor (ECF subfamily)